MQRHRIIRAAEGEPTVTQPDNYGNWVMYDDVVKHYEKAILSKLEELNTKLDGIINADK